MNQLILIFGFILVFASCSQKQFTFRKKIKVNNAEIAVLKPIQNDVVSASNPAFISNDKLVETYHQPLPFIEQTNAISTPNMYVLPDDTIRKKYNFGDNKSSNDSLKNNQSNTKTKVPNEPVDNNAMVGFWLAISSLIIFPLAAIPGLIYSILGLKSEKKKGFAMAGLIISSLIILFIIFIIWVILMFISATSAA